MLRKTCLFIIEFELFVLDSNLTCIIDLTYLSVCWSVGLGQLELEFNSKYFHYNLPELASAKGVLLLFNSYFTKKSNLSSLTGSSFFSSQFTNQRLPISCTELPWAKIFCGCDSSSFLPFQLITTNEVVLFSKFNENNYSKFYHPDLSPS